jgi:hypothetical protein
MIVMHAVSGLCHCNSAVRVFGTFPIEMIAEMNRKHLDVPRMSESFHARQALTHFRETLPIDPIVTQAWNSRMQVLDSMAIGIVKEHARKDSERQRKRAAKRAEHAKVATATAEDTAAVARPE